MNIELGVKSRFLDLFYPEIECEIPGTGSKLMLHILQIANNKFSYFQLVEELTDAVVTFSLSRMKIDEFKREGKDGRLYTHSVKKFRKYVENYGESGELLLYCFLETHLNAPKILSKLEIKTSSNDYAKGSDGVHLLKLDESNYQLVFGESKIDASLTNCISEAFYSINDFITRKDNNINDELHGLIDTQLCKEAYDEDLYKAIKSIIFPSAREQKYNTDNAFGIFAGFETSITEEEKKLNQDACRKLIRKKLKEEVEGKISHIQNKIRQYNLFGYNFYLYVFPFTDIAETRKRIIENLKEAKNDY